VPTRRLDLDTALLRSFAAVAGTRSFTRAAALVGRTQPAVTLQIARLETLLGAKLLARTSREVSLTPAGAALLPKAREMLALLDAVPAGLGEAAEAGEVRFGSPEDFATAYLPDILARFVETHPRVHLTTHCELTVRLEEGMAAGAYDLVVIKQDPHTLPPGARPLWWREKLVWAAAGEAPRLPHGEPLPLVLSPEPCVYRRAAIRALEEAGRPWSVVFTSPSLAGAAAAVRAGLGVTVLPRRLMPQGLGPLPRGAGLPALPDTAICLVLRPGAPPAAEALARAVEQRLSH
jgi:DNA-binding transcriptional LysR family regulator